MLWSSPPADMTGGGPGRPGGIGGTPPCNGRGVGEDAEKEGGLEFTEGGGGGGTSRGIEGR